MIEREDLLNSTNIAITDLDLPFWGITCLLIKCYFAFITASLIIATIFAILAFAFAIITGITLTQLT